MASNNVLLGSGKLVDLAPEATPTEEQVNAPAWRFHVDCPKGILVKTDKRLAELDAAGWKDEPGKVRLLPGHEAVWEAEQAKEANETLPKTVIKETYKSKAKEKSYEELIAEA